MGNVALLPTVTLLAVGNTVVSSGVTKTNLRPNQVAKKSKRQTRIRRTRRIQTLIVLGESGSKKRFEPEPNRTERPFSVQVQETAEPERKVRFSVRPGALAFEREREIEPKAAIFQILTALPRPQYLKSGRNLKFWAVGKCHQLMAKLPSVEQLCVLSPASLPFGEVLDVIDGNNDPLMAKLTREFSNFGFSLFCSMECQDPLKRELIMQFRAV
ncbi:hypothetical protein FB45DRAFT_872266 [Roridomyces roridus]|uniref:Uncharacterized protein n=1 Tax=Roridomyces roridus TaxID=1738132 RepID=A0AAD7FDP1_9AGAR|nr:hypothetical protein FB45DRAFT_872266 [Roridomyces roridus]